MKYKLTMLIFVVALLSVVGFAQYSNGSYTGFPNYPLFFPPAVLIYGEPVNLYVNPIVPNASLSGNCIEPYGIAGEIRVFGINQKAEFQCSGGAWRFIRFVSGTTITPVSPTLPFNLTGLEISSLINESCTLPVSREDFKLNSSDFFRTTLFPIIIQNNRNVSINYSLEVIQEPGSGSGDAGFIQIDQNGNIGLVNKLNVNLSAGQVAQVNLISGMFLPDGIKYTNYEIKVKVNSTNTSAILNFTHDVYRKPAVNLNLITEAVKRVIELRPETYFIRITNPIPYKACGLQKYILLKEVPDQWLGRIEIDGETDVIFLKSLDSIESRFTIIPARNIEPGKRYQSNFIVTQDLPFEIETFRGASDLRGIDVDNNFIYLIAMDKIIFTDKRTLSSVSYRILDGKSIAVDTGLRGNVYWSEDARIMCSNKVRFSPNRIVNNVNARNIAVTENYLYFSQGNSIYRIVKDCGYEQVPEKIYSVNGMIKDISAANAVLYWIEEISGVKTIKSVGESHITSNGATNVFTLGERNADMLYVLKGSGRVGELGRVGVYYASNSYTGKISRLRKDNDSIIIGGVGVEPVVSFAKDLALDNESVFWIQNGVKVINQENRAEYISVYYEYISENPTISIFPTNTTAYSGELKEFTVTVTNKASANINYKLFVESPSAPWKALIEGKDILDSSLGPKKNKNYKLTLNIGQVTENKTVNFCVRMFNDKLWLTSGTSKEFTACVDVNLRTLQIQPPVPKPPPTINVTKPITGGVIIYFDNLVYEEPQRPKPFKIDLSPLSYLLSHNVLWTSFYLLNKTV